MIVFMRMRGPCLQVQWYYEDAEELSAFPHEVNKKLEDSFQEKLPGVQILSDGQVYHLDLRNNMWHKTKVESGADPVNDDDDDETPDGTLRIRIVRHVLLGQHTYSVSSVTWLSKKGRLTRLYSDTVSGF